MLAGAFTSPTLFFFCKAQCLSKQRYDNDNNSRYNSSRRVFRLVCQQVISVNNWVENVN